MYAGSSVTVPLPTFSVVCLLYYSYLVKWRKQKPQARLPVKTKYNHANKGPTTVPDALQDARDEIGVTLYRKV